MECVVTIGVDVGQRSDPTAVVVCEQEDERYIVRHLERIPLGTPYPQVADRLAAIYRNATAEFARRQEKRKRRAGSFVFRTPDDPEMQERRARESVWVLVDATGCGLPVVDFLRERSGINNGHLTAVMFTAGERTTVRRGDREGTVAKSYLVSRLQALMGYGRILLPNTDEARALASELEDFEISVNAQANTQWGARHGSHDDLVCALGLAVLTERGPHKAGSISYL